MTYDSTNEQHTDGRDAPASRLRKTTRRGFMSTLAAGSVTAGGVQGQTSGLAPRSESGTLSNHGYGASGYGAGPYGGSQSDGPPILPGQDAAPTDPDNDGMYEDLDGDGELTIFDVRTLFLLRNNQVLADNLQFFNFDDGNDDIDVFDVRALFNEFADDD